MKGEYPDDTFTENDVLGMLESRNLKYKQGPRYLLSQCPLHEDVNPSAQIYKDDWFVNCHADCGRFHITKAFPQLRQNNHAQHSSGDRQLFSRPVSRREQTKTANKDLQNRMKYKEVDLMDFWKTLPEIPDSHELKTIPAAVLNELGWRWDAENERYFIPYFSATKQSIPFAQWRNLDGNPRFNMWKDAKPTCYGTWNLDNKKIFIVEGTSDSAVLEYCSVPFVGLPSSSSGALMQSLCGYMKKNGIQAVYAGDNDSAGNKLRDVIEKEMPYRLYQPPKKYNDWGEFLEGAGFDEVFHHLGRELDPTIILKEPVEQIFPDSTRMVIDGDSSKSKEQSEEPPKLL